jgi:DNA-binding GntR family transcriptional regulator
MKIGRLTMSHRVYEILKEGIFDQTYPPGTKLTEKGIASSLGVSPTPVREAFKRLESESFVENLPYKGIYIKSFTNKEVEEAYRVRAKMESLSLSLIMKDISDEQIKTITELFEEGKSRVNIHPNKRFVDFHEWIIYESNSSVILRILTSLNAVINIGRLITNIGPVDETEIIERHRILLNYIQTRNSKAAEAQIERIILELMKMICFISD